MIEVFQYNLIFYTPFREILSFLDGRLESRKLKVQNHMKRFVRYLLFAILAGITFSCGEPQSSRKAPKPQPEDSQSSESERNNDEQEPKQEESPEGKLPLIESSWDGKEAIGTHSFLLFPIN